MAKVAFLFLNRHEVEGLLPDMATVMEIVEGGLAAHGRGDVVLPPKSHIHLDDRFNGHFNVLPGYAGHVKRAGVKVVGDYVDNYRQGLPSEIALLTIYDPATGIPLCLMDATVLTWARTGAVTGIGAKHLARQDASVVGHIGARGTAMTNLKAIAACRPIREVRIASKRPETRQALAARVQEELGIRATPVTDAGEAADGADIVVEATRLEAASDLIGEAMIKPGALLVTYGWVRAVAEGLATGVDRLVVDDWEQCTKGGTFADLIAAGRLTRDGLYAEIGEICAGTKSARNDDRERITFWHRGFAISDIVLGNAIHGRAVESGMGRELLLWDGPDE